MLLLGFLPNSNFKKEAPDGEKKTHKGPRAGGSLACSKSRKRVSGPDRVIN